MTDLSTESRRSWVRIVVTYLFSFAYVAAAGYLIFEFTNGGNAEAALATFAGLGTFASAVVGFWFGNRKSNTSISRPAKETLDA